MKFNETQKNLIALLPAHEIINKLTDSAKLVLAQIDLLHGTNFAMENGYVFTTNEQLCKDTGVKARQTVITAVKVLRKMKLIELESGGRHRANRYRLTDLYYELSGDENTFKNQAKEEVPKNKNQAVDIELELEIEPDIKNMLEYTCTGEDNLKNQHNMKIDERLITEDEKDAWKILNISDDFDYTQYEDISEMVQSDAGNIGMMENPTYFEKKKNNEYVSKMFRKLSYYIKEYKESTFVETANDWGCKVNNLYGSLDRSKFKDAQWKVISKMMDDFDYLYECKEKFLSKKYHKQTGSNVTKKTVSSENSIISDGLSDSEHCPSPAPSIEKEDNMMIMRATMSEDEIAQLSKKSATQHEEKKYGKYDSVDEWLKAYNEKWGLTTQEPMAAYGNNSSM